MRARLLLILGAFACGGPVDTSKETELPAETDTQPDIDTDVETDVGPPLTPLDPALDGHPRLVALPADLEAIRSRAATGLAAQRLAELDARVAADCARAGEPPDGTSPWWSAAAAARACAWLGWRDGDTAAAEKAAALLAGLPVDAWLVPGSDDPHLSTALALQVQAVDLLLATGVDAGPAAARTLELVRSVWQRFVVEEAFWLAASQSNHNLKMAAAVGLAGLLYDDEPEAAAWLGWGLQEIDRVYGRELTTAAGGFGEGPYYQSYSDFQVVPFLRARSRLLGPGPVVVAPECRTWMPGTCPDAPFEVEDGWGSERMRAAWRWNLSLRRPDGRRAPIDDSVAIGAPTALLAELDPVFGWDWATLEPPHVNWAGDVAVDILAAWDGAMAEPAGARCEASAETGTAVLATGWGPDDAWAILLGESSGPMTPTGHEHPDAGTLQYSLGATNVLIDPGYAGWDLRARTNAYSDHSGLLVGGEGLPSGHGIDISASWSLADPCAPRVLLDHHGVGWERGLRLAGRALVVEDTFDAALGRALELRLHLGPGTAELRPWGWLVHQGVLQVAVVLQVEAALSIETDDDAPAYGQIGQHSVLVARWTAGDERATTVVVEVAGEPVVERWPEIVVDGARFGR